MRAWTLATVGVAAVLGCASSHPATPVAQTGPEKAPAVGVALPPPAYRLTQEVRPLSARIQLTLDPDSDRFTGEVVFEIDVRAPQDALVLHGKKLSVSRAELRLASGAKLPLVPVVFPDKLAFRAAATIPAGPAQLSIFYAGQVREKEKSGIFRSRIADRWYLFTQFEATDARWAFPCFDEPGFKHPWQLTVQVPAGLEVASNTPILSSTVSGKSRTVVFTATPPLPSYLVALVVGPFAIAEGRAAGSKRIPVRVLTPQGRAREASYAVEVMPRLVEIEEAYLGRPYPYEKLDLVSVPDFGGAMENPGLITYTEVGLLSLPERDYRERQSELVSVAAHELAHHWFGDSVTAAWWTDIWLNEAMASFMEPKGVVPFFPGWDGKDTTVRSRAMTADAKSSARRIRQPVENDSDVEAAFDNITYQKGELILEMFEAAIGPEVFRRGLSLYLSRHVDGSATVEDLLGALSEVGGPEVAAGFRSFLDQNGIPAVAADVSCSGGTASVRLTQSRYQPLGATPAPATLWRIPVCVAFGTGDKRDRRCTWLTEHTTTVVLPVCPAWVLPNDGMAGYFHLRLSATQLDALLGAGLPRLTVPERFALIGDVEAMVDAGQLGYWDALGAARHFAKDPSARVTLGVVQLATRYPNLVGGQEEAQARMIRGLLGVRAQRVGFADRPDDDEDTVALRPLLLGAVGVRGRDPALQTEARRLSREWLRSPESIPQSAVEPALAIAVASNDAEVFDALVERLRTEKEVTLRWHMVVGLAAAGTPERVSSALALAPAALTVLEFGYLARKAGDRPQTRDAAFRAVDASFDRYRAQALVGGVTGLLRVARGFCSREDRDRVKATFEARASEVLGGAQALLETLDAIDQCSALRDAQAAQTQAWLVRTWGRPRTAAHAAAK